MGGDLEWIRRGESSDSLGRPRTLQKEEDKYMMQSHQRRGVREKRKGGVRNGLNGVISIRNLFEARKEKASGKTGKLRLTTLRLKKGLGD